MNWVLVAIVAYLLLQLAIGAWVAPRIHTEQDYLIGGRRLGYPLTIFSIFATWFGAESCIASAARVHREGFSLTSAEPFGYGLTLIAMGVVFAVPLWRRKLTTLADLFLERYGPRVEKLAALLLVPTGLLWAAAQLRGFGHVITTVTALDLDVAILAAAGFCVAYTTLGGLLADAITDLMQGVMVIAGLVLLAVLVVAEHGGLEATMAAVRAHASVAVPADPLPPLALLEEWLIPVAGSLLAVELVSRVIAARSPEVARNSALIAGGIYITVGLLPVFVGLAAFGLVGELADPEQFLPMLARDVLPTAAYVIFAGALISAILSTVDTILLVASGVLMHNVVAPTLGIAGEAQRLRLVRVGVALLGGVALWLAVVATDVAALVEEASAFGNAGVLVVVSFALFTTFGGPMAATTALVGALASYLGWTLTGAPYPFTGSLLVALVGYVAVGSWERRRHARP
jgi:Na+/proline symporter